MSRIRIEFTIEPFVDGAPGGYVAAAVASLAESGFVTDVGPFGSAIDGEVPSVLAAFSQAATAAFDHGAQSMTVSIERHQTAAPGAAEFLDTIRPILLRLGAVIIEPSRRKADDAPIEWGGQIIGAVRFPATSSELHDAVPRLVAQVEFETGSPLHLLSREGKQHAARRLEELGAFNFRNAAEVVADAFGVTRMTVYNYLSAMRAAPPDSETISALEP